MDTCSAHSVNCSSFMVLPGLCVLSLLRSRGRFYCLTCFCRLTKVFESLTETKSHQLYSQRQSLKQLSWIWGDFSIRRGTLSHAFEFTILGFGNVATLSARPILQISFCQTGLSLSRGSLLPFQSISSKMVCVRASRKDASPGPFRFAAARAIQVVEGSQWRIPHLSQVDRSLCGNPPAASLSLQLKGSHERCAHAPCLQRHPPASNALALTPNEGGIRNLPHLMSLEVLLAPKSAKNSSTTCYLGVLSLESSSHLLPSEVLSNCFQDYWWSQRPHLPIHLDWYIAHPLCYHVHRWLLRYMTPPSEGPSDILCWSSRTFGPGESERVMPRACEFIGSLEILQLHIRKMHENACVFTSLLAKQSIHLKQHVYDCVCALVIRLLPGSVVYFDLSSPDKKLVPVEQSPHLVVKVHRASPNRHKGRTAKYSCPPLAQLGKGHLSRWHGQQAACNIRLF